MVDPITIIVTALATGAAAGLKPTAEKAVKDAYEGLKNIIRKKYAMISVDIMEGDPASEAQQGVVTENLKKTDVGSDEEVLRQARLVLDLIQKFEPSIAEKFDIDIEGLRAGASILIKDFELTDTTMKISDVKADKDITITGMRTRKDKTPQDPRGQ